MKKKIFLLVSLTILIIFGLGFSSSASAEDSNYSIGYYCPPYTTPFIAWGYYEVSQEYIAHHFICWNCWEGSKYADLYKGVVGDSEIVAGIYLGSGGDDETFDIIQFASWSIPLVEGDDLFVVIYEYSADMRNYFLTGSPAPQNRFKVLSFRYGTTGWYIGYTPEIPDFFDFDFDYPYPFGTTTPPTLVFENLTNGINYILNPLGNWTNFFAKFFDPQQAEVKANEMGAKIILVKSYFNYFDNFFGGFPVALIFTIFLMVLTAKVVFTWVAKIINLIKP